MSIQENNLSIFVCPFCFEYKMLYQKPMTKDADHSMKNHIDNCPVRKKNREREDWYGATDCISEK